MKIYVAGKYGNHLPSVYRLDNVMKAIETGRQLILKGHNPFIPHLTHFIHEGWDTDIGEKWYELDLEWLKCCDAIFMIDNWEDSKGAKLEYQKAIDLEIQIYYRMEDVPNGSSL